MISVTPLELMAGVSPVLFAVSGFLFSVGFLSAYPVMRYDIGVLQWYPLWVWRQVREALGPEDSWLKLFVFLFGFNSVSLFVNFVSGWGVVLPYFLVYLLGLNLGVVGLEEAGGFGAVGLLVLNPVAWLELPAAFLASALGMQLGSNVLMYGVGGGLGVFPVFFRVFVLVVLPLLFVAAVLEASLIRLFGGRSDSDV